MPSIAQISASTLNKRKRDPTDGGALPYAGDERDLQMKLSGSSPQSHPSLSQFHTDYLPSNLHIDPFQNRVLLKPASRSNNRGHDSKRQRIITPASVPTWHEAPPQSHQDAHDLKHVLSTPSQIYEDSEQKVPAATRPVPTRTLTNHDLSPCHICHRKPTVKSDLDSYASCEGCGKRSCYICIRECLGPLEWEAVEMPREQEEEERMDEDHIPHNHEHNGRGRGKDKEDTIIGQEWKERGTQHRGMVCSRCCVERGVDGEVRCLGCLRTHGG